MPVPIKEKDFSRKLARERIYLTLREWIINGTLVPGERILDDELASYFNTSRTPVREALQTLSAQRLVEISPGKMTCVAELDASDISKWYLPMASLQGLAAELACDLITDEQIEELKEINERFDLAIKSEDSSVMLREDEAFHTEMLKIADNEFLTEFCQLLTTYIHRIAFAYFLNEQHDIESVNAHNRIIDAFSKRDKERSYDVSKQNWLVAMKRLQERLDERLTDKTPL